MCGIVAATCQRDVVPILIAGLKALEYRGYDSAGIAVLGDDCVRPRGHGVRKLRCVLVEVDREQLGLYPEGLSSSRSRAAGVDDRS